MTVGDGAIPPLGSPLGQEGPKPPVATVSSNVSGDADGGLGADQVRELARRIRAEIARVITGQEGAVDLMLIALLSSGHILLEGPPGTAKTLLARCFAATLALDFGRIQFTPDLMPGDLLGANLFNFQTSTFTLTRGPIFCELLLADEINRTPPKTQAALLEAMQERSVTIDGQTHELSPNFMVVATENPIEQQGVYPLPEAQLDRFLFKHIMPYPSLEEEEAIVARHSAAPRAARIEDWAVAPVANAAMLANCARARAVLEGRAYVIPDDVKALAPALLRHRVILSPAAQIEGATVNSVIDALIESIDAPR